MRFLLRFWNPINEIAGFNASRQWRKLIAVFSIMVMLTTICTWAVVSSLEDLNHETMVILLAYGFMGLVAAWIGLVMVTAMWKKAQNWRRARLALRDLGVR